MDAQEAIRLELERAAWLIERLARDVGHAPQRGELRRTLQESQVAEEQSGSQPWWRFVSDAAESQGLRARISDCTLDEVCALVDDGARLVVPTASYDFAILQKSGGWRYQLVTPDGIHPVTKAGLNAELSPCQVEARYRCLIVVPHGTLAHGAHQSPLNRLIALLRPESRDIWTVVAFSVVVGLLALATPLAVESLVNTVAFGKFVQPVVILSIILFAFLLFRGAIQALQTYVVEVLQRRLFARVAADVAYRLPRTPVEGLDDLSGRELVNRFLDIVTVQKVAAQFLLDGIGLVLGTFIGMAVLAFYHPFLLGFDLLLLLLIFAGVLILGRGAIATSIKESKTKYSTLAWLEDVAGSPVAFRYGGARDFVLERADKLTYDYLKARGKHFSILYRQICFTLGLQALANTVLLGLGGWLVINQQLSLGQLVASELIVATIVGAFAKLGKHIEGYYDLMASVDKLGSLFDLPIEDQGGLLTFADFHPAAVDVESASYSRPKGRSGLSNVSLKLKSGERAVLAGKSGSGKSVLLDLLFGTRRVSAGHILMNGIDVRDYRPDILRQHVALVRAVEVFDGTVADNVHLGRPQISIADVRAALDEVGLLDDILKMPDGIQSHLTSTGAPLSSNQRRLLMIARAIVGRPRLLLVDGLLDAMPDTLAEQLIDVLCNSSQPWTLLLVSGHDRLTKGLRRIELDRPELHAEKNSEEAAGHEG
ncbi:MAG: ATP-binding cassette domain-containing protein [Planctomycetaceae bacterium]|nr:ATP-binding cassette domain-containing protein [Planctomycetaceae bacterium]